MRLPWFTALVNGPSMAPTLRHGDAVLVRRAAGPPGRVTWSSPGSAAGPTCSWSSGWPRREGDGWWLVGDNPFVIDDSRAYGVADVIGRVRAAVVAPHRPSPRVRPRVVLHRETPAPSPMHPEGISFLRCRRHPVSARSVFDEPVFELHEGGKIAVQSTVAAEPPATTSPLRTRPAWPSVRGDRGRRVAHAPLHLGRAHGRGGDRRLGRARPGQHRPARRDAGDGGQGRAVQAVRRRRRGADLPGHAGRRTRSSRW